MPLDSQDDEEDDSSDGSEDQRKPVRLRSMLHRVDPCRGAEFSAADDVNAAEADDHDDPAIDDDATDDDKDTLLRRVSSVRCAPAYKPDKLEAESDVNIPDSAEDEFNQTHGRLGFVEAMSGYLRGPSVARRNNNGTLLPWIRALDTYFLWYLRHARVKCASLANVCDPRTADKYRVSMESMSWQLNEFNEAFAQVNKFAWTLSRSVQDQLAMWRNSQIQVELKKRANQDQRSQQRNKRAQRVIAERPSDAARRPLTRKDRGTVCKYAMELLKFCRPALEEINARNESNNEVGVSDLVVGLRKKLAASLQAVVVMDAVPCRVGLLQNMTLQDGYEWRESMQKGLTGNDGLFVLQESKGSSQTDVVALAGGRYTYEMLCMYIDLIRPTLIGASILLMPASQRPWLTSEELSRAHVLYQRY
jgi:hypothetical protein